jgi:hypothetical protein
MDAFLEYLSAKNPDMAAPTNAPSCNRAVMMLDSQPLRTSSGRVTYPLFHPAREVAASSTSGKSDKNRGITKTIESRP